MSAIPENDFALLALLDAGNMSPTSCDGMARDMIVEAALEYARSRGWMPPDAEAQREMKDLRELLGVEDNQSLVDAARWFTDTAEVPALRDLEKEVRLFLTSTDSTSAENWDLRAMEILQHLDWVRSGGA